MRRQIFGDPKEGRLRGGRAKIRYGSFYFQIKTFDRDREVVRGKISARWSVGNSRGGYTQMFDKINSSEIVRSTSSCTIHVFNEEDSNSIIRKTVQRTHIRLHVVSHPLQVLVQRCPVFYLLGKLTSRRRERPVRDSPARERQSRGIC